ncbi:MAG: heparinase II/III family protein, partial [Alphaproteobacteria bacterium]
RGVVQDKSGVRCTASHDGYRHLGLTHTRSVHVGQDAVRGEDVVACTTGKTHRVRAHFHLHPKVKCKLKDETIAELQLPSGTKLLFRVIGGRLYKQDSMYCPQFGVRQASTQLVIQANWRKGAKVEWVVEVVA